MYRKSLSLPIKVLTVASKVRCFSVASAGNANDAVVGFVGLGHMGSKMVENLSKDGRKVIVFDANAEAVKRVVAASAAGSKSVSAGSLDDIAKSCTVIFSMLPNDVVVESITNSLVKAGDSKKSSFTHISCSTISPSAARRLAQLHVDQGHKLVTAPVFARPDGTYATVLYCIILFTLFGWS
jgi:3-hydroxyisobutyrate dehydrogenase-like beta-hydroxyacid dehydrogenase